MTITNDTIHIECLQAEISKKIKESKCLDDIGGAGDEYTLAADHREFRLRKLEWLMNGQLTGAVETRRALEARIWKLEKRVDELEGLTDRVLYRQTEKMAAIFADHTARLLAIEANFRPKGVAKSPLNRKIDDIFNTILRRKK